MKKLILFILSFVIILWNISEGYNLYASSISDEESTQEQMLYDTYAIGTITYGTEGVILTYPACFILIELYEQHNSGYLYIDSTYTDINGEYSIGFMRERLNVENGNNLYIYIYTSNPNVRVVGEENEVFKKRIDTKFYVIYNI